MGLAMALCVVGWTPQKTASKLPELSAGDVVNLQKQILDLQEQLHEFSRPVGGGDN